MSSDNSPSKDKSSTSDWLESILDGHFSTMHPEKDDEIEVIDWDINPVEGEGYLFEVLTIDVRYSLGDQERRACLVAKLLPQNPFNRAFVIETQFDFREIKFYTEIVPCLLELQKKRLSENEATPLSIPACFHTVYKEDAESILVLEDLKFKGFVHQDLNSGLTLRQAEATVESLAQIHALSLALQLDNEVELERLFPYLLSKEKAEEAFHNLFEKGLPLLLKYLQKKPQHSVVREGLRNYSGNRSRDIFQRVLSPSDKLNTLVHGDFWSNNLLYRTTNEVITCSIIDWQMLMKGKPSIDLGMLITTSLTPQDRRDHEISILRTYWRCFTNHLHKLGVKDKERNYTFDDLTSDVKDGKLFGALVMIGSVDMALGDPAREDRVLSLIKDLIKDGII